MKEMIERERERGREKGERIKEDRRGARHPELSSLGESGSNLKGNYGQV